MKPSAPTLALGLPAVLAANCDSPTTPSAATAALYATAEQGSVLVQIDPTTGAAAVVGPLNVSGAFALAARRPGCTQRGLI